MKKIHEKIEIRKIQMEIDKFFGRTFITNRELILFCRLDYVKLHKSKVLNKYMHRIGNYLLISTHDAAKIIYDKVWEK